MCAKHTLRICTPSRVCIARAAVNESDSHTEHVQLARPAVSTQPNSFCKYRQLLVITHVDTKYLVVKTRTGNFINTIATNLFQLSLGQNIVHIQCLLIIDGSILATVF